MLFKFPRRRSLPEKVFIDDDGAALVASPRVRLKRRIEVAQIASLSAHRDGKFASFAGTESHGKRFRFKLPKSEAVHLIEALTMLLGERFSSALSREDLAREGRQRSVVGIIFGSLLLLGGLGMIVVALLAEIDAEAGPGHSQVHLVFATQLPLLLNFYGIAAVLLSGTYLSRRVFEVAAHRRPAGAEPLRSHSVGIVCRLAGIVLFVGGYMFSINLSYCGALFLYLGYCFGLRGGAATLKGDGRPPVLYLRSFGDDGKNNLNPDSLTAILLGLRDPGLLEKLGPLAHCHPLRMIRLLLGTATDTAEEQLGSFFRRLAPFIAIGKPGELFATGGADRLYIEQDAWQQRARDLIDRSAGVVLQPASTEGVWWEIETCVARVEPGRLLLCLVNYEHSQQAYEEFRLRFEDLRGSPLPRTRGAAEFMWVDEQGAAHLLPTVYRSPLLWPLLGFGVDLRATLWPFLHRLHPVHYAKSPRPPSPVLFRLGQVAALIVWGTVFWGLPYAIGTAMGTLDASIDYLNNLFLLGSIWRTASPVCPA